MRSKYNFLISPNERHSHAILKTTALWSLRYENQNSKNFALRLRMNPLQFSGTSIFIYYL